MIKRILPLLALLCWASMASAKPVDVTTARRVAERFFPGQQLSVTDMEGLYLFVPNSGKGFALVSADDCVRPLLAYSMDGNFSPDNMPAHVALWIEGYRREIAAVASAGVAPSPEVQAQWEHLLPRKSAGSVAPLLSTRWAQGSYYNLYCPYDTVDSTHCVTGCVATAMAQIMRYWEWPVVGFGSHTYVHSSYGALSAQYDTTHYRWNQMPDTLNALCDNSEVEAVATLMHDAGVAVEMMYGPRGSGAYSLANGGLDFPCAENAMKTYFRYNPLLIGLSKSGFADEEWDSMLRRELDAARPVYYSGSDRIGGGHAFVIDGYDTLGMFHLNWGWGGYYDAYYTIDSLSPGAGTWGDDPIYTFNYYNAALFDVYPVSTATDTVVNINFVTNDSTLGTVLGSGTYRLYDTVTIMPRAAEGCRYLSLASGQRNIPFTFLAFNNMDDTVLFERVLGDTVGYCSDVNVTSWRDDYSATTEWGIRIPAVMRRSRQLTAVQLYYSVEGDYTLNIYQGDAIDDATPLYTGVYSFDGEPGWRTIALDSMLTFHHTRTLWITVSITDTNRAFPLACDSYRGNPDGSWYHLPWGWQTYDQMGVYFTWMLRAVFDPRDRYHVAAAPNDIEFGDISGMGDYVPGDTVTLTAIPHQGYHFLYWSNGSTDNPLHFGITCDTTFVAFFEPIVGIGEAETPALKVDLSGLTLTVDNPSGLPVDLYDVTGRHLATSNLPVFNFQFSTPGVYLLKTAGLPARKIVAIK